MFSMVRSLPDHLEPEAERLKVVKPSRAYVAKSSSRKSSKPKRGKKFANAITPKGLWTVVLPKGKKANEDLNGKVGHFTREYTELNKLIPSPDLSMCLVSSTVFIAHSFHMWIIDFRATDHIARDWNGFMEYCCILADKKVYIGNDSSVDVLALTN